MSLLAWDNSRRLEEEDDKVEEVDADEDPKTPAAKLEELRDVTLLQARSLNNE